MGRKYTVRHGARRKLEACANLCDTINQHLATASKLYEIPEPERYATFLEIGSIVEEARKLLVAFREVL